MTYLDFQFRVQGLSGKKMYPDSLLVIELFREPTWVDPPWVDAMSGVRLPLRSCPSVSLLPSSFIHELTLEGRCLMEVPALQVRQRLGFL